VNYLLELAESRTNAARLKSDELTLIAAARVADLDQEETPESIMLSSMTEEGTKERTDREMVVPWLRFLWEIYRANLELLYKIPKLEKVYHDTCRKAFKFCLDFKRSLEFRRLCEMLRNQLINLQKTPPVTARNRVIWEWTTEAVEFHLNTRFAQLEVATSLELWNEGFRTIEDIYAIMVAGKKTPKAKLMMNYYDKLQRIFWVSDNKLFHGYAWYRYYCLFCESKKEIKPDDKCMLASSVLLSAITVPSTRDMYSFADEEEELVEKSSQMALLLDFQSNPSRQSLLNDISSKGILNEVLPELKALYESLEIKFQPLALVDKIVKALAIVKATPTLSIYAIPLQKVAVVKLLQQLGRVYSTIKLQFLYKLLSNLSDMTPTIIERILIEGVAAKQLQLKVNHITSSIHFYGQTLACITALDSQAAIFGSQVNKISYNIMLKLDVNDTIQSTMLFNRTQFLSTVAGSTEIEYSGSLDRKAQIERRKEEQERQKEDRLREEMIRLEHEEQKRLLEEEQRLENEEKQRILDKQRKDREKLEILRVKNQLEKLGVSTDESVIAELDNVARRSLIADAQNEAMKAKEEENRKLVEQAKRLDHITRALRMEAKISISDRYLKQIEEDQLLHEQQLREFDSINRAQHTEDLLEKNRLSRFQQYRGNFEIDIIAAQKAEYECIMLEQKEQSRRNLLENIIAKARRLYYEELERQEALEEIERERIAEEERAAEEIAEYERLRIERERREAAEKEAEELREKMLRDIAEAEKAEKLRQEELLKAQPPAPVKYVPPSARGATSGPGVGYSNTNPSAAYSDKNNRDSGGGGWGGNRDSDRNSSGRPSIPNDRDRPTSDWGRGSGARAEMAGSGYRGSSGGNDVYRDSRDKEVIRDTKENDINRDTRDASKERVSVKEVEGSSEVHEKVHDDGGEMRGGSKEAQDVGNEVRRGGREEFGRDSGRDVRSGGREDFGREDRGGGRDLRGGGREDFGRDARDSGRSNFGGNRETRDSGRENFGSRANFSTRDGGRDDFGRDNRDGGRTNFGGRDKEFVRDSRDSTSRDFGRDRTKEKEDSWRG
jgi:translation initiation factor 3 subunit A